MRARKERKFCSLKTGKKRKSKKREQSKTIIKAETFGKNGTQTVT